jgi:hypothetical protein
MLTSQTWAVFNFALGFVKTSVAGRFQFPHLFYVINQCLVGAGGNH